LDRLYLGLHSRTRALHPVSGLEAKGISVSVVAWLSPPYWDCLRVDQRTGFDIVGEAAQSILGQGKTSIRSSPEYSGAAAKDSTFDDQTLRYARLL